NEFGERTLGWGECFLFRGERSKMKEMMDSPPPSSVELLIWGLKGRDALFWHRSKNRHSRPIYLRVRQVRQARSQGPCSALTAGCCGSPTASLTALCEL